jgi:hypothetical protein
MSRGVALTNTQIRAVLEAARQIWGFPDTDKIDDAALVVIKEVIDKANPTSVELLHERSSTGDIFNEKFRNYDLRKDKFNSAWLPWLTKYVCNNNCADLNPHLAVMFFVQPDDSFLEKAISAGLDASKIDSSVWSRLISSRLLKDVLHRRIHQLLELGVDIPPDSPIEIRRRNVSLHLHLAQNDLLRARVFQVTHGSTHNLQVSSSCSR